MSLNPTPPDTAGGKGLLEIWKPILSLMGRYEASSLGRIRSAIPGKKPHIMAQNPHDKGHFYVKISFNGVHRPRPVAQLVCEAFHGPKPANKNVCAHGDGDTNNNAPSNLRWATFQENEFDKFRHGTASGILNEAQTSQCFDLMLAGVSARKVAEQFGVSRSTILDATNGRTWKHVRPELQRPLLKCRKN